MLLTMNTSHKQIKFMEDKEQQCQERKESARKHSQNSLGMDDS
jgi:hypothetical protein